MKFILHFMKNYYLKKISDGKISKAEVACLYATSLDNVEKAVKEYEINRNPFRKSDSQTRLGIIQILISIVSVTLVLLTLFEMQAERNAAYMPNISINSTGIRFAWNEHRELLNDISGYDEKYLRVWDEYDSTHTRNMAVKMAVQNTGVGVAKDVYISWFYKRNIALFQKLFSGTNDVSVDIDDTQVVISLEDGLKVGSFYPDKESFTYGFLSADLNQSVELVIPSVYIYLYKLAYANQLGAYIPSLKFSVMYKDVQGELYGKEFILKPQPIMVLTSPDNSGFGIVDLVIMENETSHLSFIEKYRFVILYCVCGIIIVAGVLVLIAIRFEIKRSRKKDNIEKKPSPTKSDIVGEDHFQNQEKNGDR